MAKKNPEILKPGKPFTTDCLAPWLDRVLVRRIVGVDPSLSCTGIAVMDDATPKTSTVESKLRGPARLAEIAHRVICRALDEPEEGGRLWDFSRYGARPSTLVLIEGYSFGSRNSQAHALGELGGILRLAFWQAKLPYVEIPPSMLKKFATGKGNSDKRTVAVEVVKRWGFEAETEDEVDAFGLARMGYDLACQHGAFQGQKTAKVRGLTAPQLEVLALLERQLVNVR